MTPHSLYNFCRSVRKWSKLEKQKFDELTEKNFYYLLLDYFVKKREMTDKDIKLYIISNHEKNPDSFSPFSLMNEECYELFKEFKNKRALTEQEYYDSVIKDIIFIENYCLKNNIKTFEDYIKKYAPKHIREKKFDWIIAVYYNMIDINKLNTIDRIMFKPYIMQYKKIERRIKENPKLVTVIEKRVEQLKGLLFSFFTVK
jgi:NTP pyrophosphatase (non-canonical NTP hydrolase)